MAKKKTVIKKKSQTRRGRQIAKYYAEHKQPTYQITDVVDYYLSRKHAGKITGEFKHYSDAQITHIIKETYYGEDWQGKVNTKLRFKEFTDFVNRSEFFRSAAQRGRESVWKELIKWGNSEEFKALGGKMYDDAHLQSLSNHAWVYNTDDGYIILEIEAIGGHSIPQFIISKVTTNELREYGSEAPENSAFHTLWGYKYGDL